MADDIVERLRVVHDVCLRYHECFECGQSWWDQHRCACDCHEGVWVDAAAEIERLRSENKRLDGLLIRQNTVMADDVVSRLLHNHSDNGTVPQQRTIVDDNGDQWTVTSVKGSSLWPAGDPCPNDGETVNWIRRATPTTADTQHPSDGPTSLTAPHPDASAIAAHPSVWLQ